MDGKKAIERIKKMVSKCEYSTMRKVFYEYLDCEYCVDCAEYDDCDKLEILYRKKSTRAKYKHIKGVQLNKTIKKFSLLCVYS